MKVLLDKTHIAPEAIGYLNARVKSTQIGDRAVMFAIQSLFSNCKQWLHISSTKVLIFSSV